MKGARSAEVGALALEVHVFADDLHDVGGIAYLLDHFVGYHFGSAMGATTSSGITSAPPRARRPRRGSLQLHHGDARAAFVPGSDAKVRNPRFLAEHLGDALAESARSLSVDDAKRLEIRANCCVDRMHNYGLDLTDAQPAQIDLARRVDFRKISPNGNRDFRGGRLRSGRAVSYTHL